MTRVDDLRRLTQRFFRRFGALSADSTPCGKPLPMGHAHALMILERAEDMSQQALGAELCIDKSNVARLCAKMVAAGHAKQRPCADDRRSRRVTLTAKGRRVAQEVDQASRAKFGALLAAIPRAQRGGVVDALEALLQALESPQFARVG